MPGLNALYSVKKTISFIEKTYQRSDLDTDVYCKGYIFHVQS